MFEIGLCLDILLEVTLGIGRRGCVFEVVVMKAKRQDSGLPCQKRWGSKFRESEWAHLCASALFDCRAFDVVIINSYFRYIRFMRGTIFQSLSPFCLF